MMYDIEQRLERLEKGLQKAEATVEKKGFRTYLKRKLQTFFDDLSIKEWAVIIVAIYLISVVAVTITKAIS
jgi:hypothetical protein